MIHTRVLNTIPSNTIHSILIFARLRMLVSQPKTCCVRSVPRSSSYHLRETSIGLQGLGCDRPLKGRCAREAWSGYCRNLTLTSQRMRRCIKFDYFLCTSEHLFSGDCAGTDRELQLRGSRLLTSSHPEKLLPGAGCTFVLLATAARL